MQYHYWETKTSTIKTSTDSIEQSNNSKGDPGKALVGGKQSEPLWPWLSKDLGITKWNRWCNVCETNRQWKTRPHTHKHALQQHSQCARGERESLGADEKRKKWNRETERNITLTLCCCCYCCYIASVVFDFMRPHRWQPTSLCCPWDSPGKNTGVDWHFFLQCKKVKSESEVARSCPTLCDTTDFSLPGFSVHGLLQARALEWVAIAFRWCYENAKHAISIETKKSGANHSK